MHVVIEIEESPYIFSVLDVVDIMGYGVGEEGKIVRYGKVLNLQGGTVHEISIYQGCVFVGINKSEDDEYVMFRSMKMNDSSKQKIGGAVGHFIMWPTEFLRPACVQL